MTTSRQQQNVSATALDPAVAVALERMALETRAGFQTMPLSVKQARRDHEVQASRLTPEGTRAEVRRVSDVRVDGGNHGIDALVYEPLGTSGPVPTILWIHGGGWVTGSLRTGDIVARELCAAGAVVVVVDYRLAPEHPFPAGLDDCLMLMRWITDNVADLGGDPERIGVGGDSAGGNLAAVVAQQAVHEKLPLAAQLLLYPVVDADYGVERYPSRHENATGYLLETESMPWLVNHYLRDPTGVHDPRVSPIRGNLAGVAPAVVVTAHFDPLRDEGEAYAEALQAAGITVRATRAPGLVHGAFDMIATSKEARTVLDQAIVDTLELMDAKAVGR